MSSGQPFTPADDARIRQLRATGLRWSDIGRQLGRDGACCRLRITRVLREPDPLAVARGAEKVAHREQLLPPQRDAYGPATLPPGSPITWGQITAGTVLDGSGYQ